VCLIRGRTCWSFAGAWFYHPIFGGFLVLIFLVFCVVFFSFVCVFILCLVYQMLPVSLDCSYLIAPSVFSNVCFHILRVVNVSVLVWFIRYIMLKMFDVSK